MSDLFELSEYMKSEGAKEAAQLLAQADSYIQMYNRMPEAFVLPREHARLKPVISQFANDLGGFVEFTKDIRDGLEKAGDGHGAIHNLYRLIQTRYVQQQRRSRVNKAVEKAIEMYGSPDFQTRQRWISDLEHAWAKRRLKYMDSVRKGLGHKRLTSEQRAGAANEFWSELDSEIAAGVGIPKWAAAAAAPQRNRRVA